MAEVLFDDAARYTVNSWGCKFVVYGKAEPGGSKSVVPRWKKWPVLVTSAKHLVSLVNVIDSNSKTKAWKSEIQIVAGTLMKGREPYEGPIAIFVDFYQVRAAGHTGKRGLHSWAPKHPIKKPDATKLLRPVEDALTGILWKDDAHIVEQHVRKFYGEPARMEFSLLVKL